MSPVIAYLEVVGSVFVTFASSFVLFLAWTYLTSPSKLSFSTSICQCPAREVAKSKSKFLPSIFWNALLGSTCAELEVKNIPGPFLAKCTNWWRLFSIYSNRSVDTQRYLHKKYGSAVQLGPNLVSLSDPSLLHTLYDTRGNYLKSKFYDNNSSKIGHEIVYNVFSTRSNKTHAHALRPIRKFFTLSSLLESEPLIDETIQELLSKLDSHFVLGGNSGKTCQMDKWLPFFTWDVMGNLSLGAPIGYLKHGSDFDNAQRTGDQTFFYFATVGQIPELDYWLVKNPVVRIGPPAFDVPAMLCAQRIAQRQREIEIEGKPTHDDMLEDFMRINREDPSAMDDHAVVVALMVNILAGGDTTGILLCAILYYVLKDQKVYKKLMEELDAANLECPVSYAATEKLHYFDAVVKEASRMHPGVGLMLERVVPTGGLTLTDGRFLPAGTIVGMNAWVIHQDKEIFGKDSASFNPERWLRGDAETEEDYRARLHRMKTHDLTFGAGARICMGRYVSILEAYKVMTTLFLTYEMSLVDPSKDWHVLYSWFTKQSGIDVKLKRRNRTNI